MSESNTLKTDIFISYRREVSEGIAVALKQSLERRGYNVFLDVANMGSGEWRHKILNEIGVRPYFLLILHPETLKRCSEPDDVLKLEIEHAMDTNRHIIPVMTSNFDFKNVKEFLVGSLRHISAYNGIYLRSDTFESNIEELHNRFLPPVSLPDEITPEIDRKEREKIVAQVVEDVFHNNPELMSYIYFERASRLKEKDIAAAIENCTQAIGLDPKFAEAYALRSTLYRKQGNVKATIEDLDRAIEYNPQLAFGYFMRGITVKDYASSLADFAKAIEVDPNLPEPYYFRALVYARRGKWDYALADCNMALKLDPNCAIAYLVRGAIFKIMGYIINSEADMRRAIHLNPAFPDIHTLMGIAKSNRWKWLKFWRKSWFQ